MADFQLNLNINGVDTAVASVEDLEAALKATKTEMNTLQIGSEAFNVAAANAQKLDSALKNVKLATEGVDTKQLAGSFAKLGETVVGGFAIATNAISIFGKENEAVSAAAVKAQQAIAIVMGARAIAEGVVEGRVAARLILEKVSVANTTLMTTLFSAEAASLAAVAVANGEATVAQYALNVAMELNPIGLVIAAVTALVGAYYLLTGSEEAEAEAQKKQTEAREAELKVIAELKKGSLERADLEQTIAQGEIDLMKANHVSRTQIHQAELKQIQDKIDAQESANQIYRGTTTGDLKVLAQLNADKKVLEANFAQETIKINQDAIDKANKAKQDGAAKSAAIDAQILAERNALLIAQETDEFKKIEIREQQKTDYLQTQLDQRKINDIQYINAVQNIQAEAQLQRKVLTDKNATEEERAQVAMLAKIEAFYALLNSSREKLNDLGNSNIKDKSEKLEAEKNTALIKLNDDYHQKLMQAAQTFGNDTTKYDEAELEILRQKNQAKVLIEQDYQDQVKAIRQAEFEEKVGQVNEYANIAASAAQSTVALLSAINEGANQERTQQINAQYSGEENALRAKLNKGEISRKEYDKREAVLNAAKAKAEYDAKKKAFESEKKLRIASTIISGIMGALQAFTGAMQLGPIAGPIVGGILAGLVVAGTAVTVSNISKQQFDGGAAPLTPIDPGAGEAAAGAGQDAIQQSSAGGFTGFAPSVAGQVGGSTTGSGTTGPVKVVVVESDITNAQRRVSVAESNATF